MRTVWVSSLLLLLLLSVVLLNSLYVCRTTEDLAALAEALPEEPSPVAVAQLEQLEQTLDRHKNRLSISVPFPRLEHVRELILSARLYAEDAGIGAGGDYATTRALLIDAIRDLGRLEKATMENIV